MLHIHAILRRAVIERGLTGSEDAREYSIERFLDELQEVVTPRLIETIPDEVLSEMFEDWVAATHHIDREQRIAATTGRKSGTGTDCACLSCRLSPTGGKARGG